MYGDVHARGRTLLRRRAKEGYRSTEGRAVGVSRHWLGRRMILGPGTEPNQESSSSTIHTTTDLYIYYLIPLHVRIDVFKPPVTFRYFSWYTCRDLMNTILLTTKDTASRKHMHFVSE